MKKLFTLSALALLMALPMNAQKVRKTWDFRNGFSAITVANLNADMEQNGTAAHWRNWEKNATDAGKYGDTFWCADNGTTVNADNELVTTVNGEEIVIPETAGLNMKGIKAKGLILATNYPQSENAESPAGIYPAYGGFIWLNGKGVIMKVNQVLKGETLRIGVESHKNTEARGINVSVDGTALTPISGEEVPTYFNEVVYQIPDDTPGVDDYAEVQIKSTSGCHIYYIIAGEGDEPVETTHKVAYIYNDNLEEENAYGILKNNADYVITPIAAADAATVTAESLQSYDVTVISSTLPADNALVGTLKEALPFIPALNLNAKLYDAWGYGNGVTTKSGEIVVTSTKEPLFSGIEIGVENEGDTWGNIGISEMFIPGVKLGGHFADDDILAYAYDGDEMAVDSSIVTVHAHNIYHNGYIYLPLSQEALTGAMAAEDMEKLINNAVIKLVSSKSDITKTPSPTFALEYKDMNTNVTIKCANKSAEIFYTIDGSEPTTASTRYEGVFNLTSACTVKAVAVAEGYLVSDASSKNVEMKTQTKAPEITFEALDGKSVVSITTATPDAKIFYNFTGAADTLSSSPYTEPFELNDSREVTAIAISDVTVLSEPTTQKVYIKNANLRIDAVAHMDANPTEYNNGSTSTAYYFSWGKNKGAYPFWDENSAIIEETEEGQVIVGYEKMNPEEVVDFGNGWKVVSRGHVMVWENIKPGKNYGIGTAYNPATVADYDTLVTNYYLNIGEWNTNYPRNGVIATSVKHKGPFDVLSFVSNGNSTGSPLLVFEVSKDSTEWIQLGDTASLATQRLYRRIVRSYEGTDEVYLRTRIADGNSKAGYYDIYIMKDGEKSAAYNKQLNDEYNAYITGIENVNTTNKSQQVVRTEVYNLNGLRTSNAGKGISIVKEIYADGSVKTKKVIRK